MKKPFRHGEEIETFTDGFGRWYAKITFPRPYSSGEMLAYEYRLRRKARDKIRGEIEVRQAEPVARLVVERDLVEHGPGRHGGAISVTYREV